MEAKIDELSKKKGVFQTEQTKDDGDYVEKDGQPQQVQLKSKEIMISGLFIIGQRERITN